VIKGFADSGTEAVWYGRRHPQLTASDQKIALRKLRLINNARALTDLKRVPGNRLEALKWDRVDQYSIRLRDGSPWRICFVWLDDGADKVEIVDYHAKEGSRE
jgi:proteic killer suppression protein